MGAEETHDLERDALAEGAVLPLRQVDPAHAAGTDLLEDPVAPDSAAGL
jgi:hypothetical protein